MTLFYFLLLLLVCFYLFFVYLNLKKRSKAWKQWQEARIKRITWEKKYSNYQDTHPVLQFLLKEELCLYISYAKYNGEQVQYPTYYTNLKKRLDAKKRKHLITHK
jgi:hypothetical protein